VRSKCAQYGYKIEAEYREVETGKGADALERRLELAAAMQQARKLATGGRTRSAQIIIAKLDTETKYAFRRTLNGDRHHSRLPPSH